MGFLEDIADKIRVWADSRYAPIGSSSGGLTIENNGTALPERSQLNIVGRNMLSSDVNENKILLFQNLPSDFLFDASRPSCLDNIWYHTDGYWYIVGDVYRTDSGSFGNINTKFRVLKTLDWIEFTTVFEHVKVGTYHRVESPRICMDESGNIIVVGGKNSSPDYRTAYFWDASTQAITVQNVSLNNSSTNYFNIMSTAIRSDGTMGLVGYADNGGSYAQLFYIERSPGAAGTWGTIVRPGATPLRNPGTAINNSIHLFYGSDGEPRIVFFNNASATSSKISVAKRSVGVWTVYESTQTAVYSAVLASSNNIYIACGTSLQLLKFNDSTNAFEDISAYAEAGFNPYSIGCDINNNLYLCNFNPIGVTVSSANGSYISVIRIANDIANGIRRIKASVSLPGNPTYPAHPIGFGMMYNRQKLETVNCIIFRIDGSMFMEPVSW